MKKVITIWKKEALGHATSPRAYVMVALTLGFTALGFFLATLINRDSSMRGTLGFLSFVMMFVTPVLTMRLLAEENSRGTLELLLTSPVGETDIVLGKFLGVLTVFLALFVLTLIFPVILFSLGTPEKGPMFTQYLGLVLSCCAFISVGLFASSITASQVIAAIVGYVLILGFWIVGVVGNNLPSTTFGQVASSIALLPHLENFNRGIVDSVDVYYYLAFTAVFLFLSWRAVEARRWA